MRITSPAPAPAPAGGAGRAGPRAAALLLLSLAAGCQASAPAPAAPEGARAAGYVGPPTVLSATRTGDRLRLAGGARAGAAVRLVSPAGEALTGAADAEGRWSLEAPAPAGPQLYALGAAAPAAEAGRVLRGRDLLLLLPDAPHAVRLRAGGGSEPLAPAEPAGVTALDYDRAGGGAVSGRAAPEAAVAVWVDGRPAARGRAGADGRFMVGLIQPLTPGVHRIALGESGGVEAEVAPAAAVQGPVQARRAGGAWRIDWRPPGGEVQTTVVFDGAPAAARP